ncbi:hypothetical protein JHK85_050306 [Glycine max]|nr:hypothetical protein JHK85_050306 [Glycine max]
MIKHKRHSVDRSQNPWVLLLTSVYYDHDPQVFLNRMIDRRIYNNAGIIQERIQIGGIHHDCMSTLNTLSPTYLSLSHTGSLASHFLLKELSLCSKVNKSTIAHHREKWTPRLIEEYDSPKKLLKNKSSSLAQLVEEYTRRSNSDRRSSTTSTEKESEGSLVLWSRCQQMYEKAEMRESNFVISARRREKKGFEKIYALKHLQIVNLLLLFDGYEPC